MKVCIFIIFYIFSSLFYVVAKENQIDSIAAVVNDTIILNSDVNQMLILLNKAGKDFKTPLKSSFLKDKVIEKLIVDSLILQEANRMHITVTKEQVDTVIKNIALKKNISMNELKNRIILHNSNSNISYEDYIKNIKKLLRIKITQDYELHKRINISEQEVNLLFEKLIKNNKKNKRINLSYILLPISKKYSNDLFRKKKKLSERIVDVLKKGYDFEKLSIACQKKKSLFVVKKMFWINFSDIQNSFSENLNIFKKGQILGPFLGNEGFYILKVNDIDNNKENIITEFYIQHCFIKPSVILTDLESKKNIFNIYEKIKTGVYNFDYAVKNLSHDVYTSNKNGDLGWVSEGFFNINFNKKLFFLKKNEISKPVKSNFGWHIFKLLDKRQVDLFYNFKKKKAYNILLEQKKILEKHNWIEDLKNFSYIKIIQ